MALAEYAAGFRVDSAAAIGTARLCLIEALGASLDALRDPACAALIGPLVPGAMMPGGARVPGTSLELDPAQAAFCISLMLCRAASRGAGLLRGDRVIDALGALLAIADYRGRKAIMEGKPPPKVRDVLAAMIKTLQIHGVLAPQRASLTRLTPAAVAIVVTAELGGAVSQIVTALSYACMDGGAAVESEDRYGDTGRGDWARADAVGRAVRYACQAMAAGSSPSTSPDATAGGPAGKVLRARPWDAKALFGTGTVDRIAATRPPQAVAEITMRFQGAVERYYPPRQAERIRALFAEPGKLDDLPVNELLAALVTNGARQLGSS